MKTTKIIKGSIDILYFLMLMGVIALFLSVIASLFTTNFDHLFNALTPIKNDSYPKIASALLNLLVMVLFFIGIFFLRKVARIFLSEKYFSTKTSKYFNLSGVYLSLCGILALFNFIYTRHHNYPNNYKIPELTLKENYLYLFLIICGLIFMLIGRVIKESIAIKEENDLTI